MTIKCAHGSLNAALLVQHSQFESGNLANIVKQAVSHHSAGQISKPSGHLLQSERQTSTAAIINSRRVDHPAVDRDQ